MPEPIGDWTLRRPRWLYRLHAFLAAYFWLPCPVCGRAFSGWEWVRDGPTLYNAARTAGQGVCSARCASNGSEPDR